MTDRPQLSIVIPTRDRPELLRRCLDALRTDVDTTDEIIVVDSASRDSRTADVVREAGVRYVRCDEPGASKARNRGWQSASHDVVVFIDDDVLVWSGWADGFARAAARFPEASFVSGKIGSPPDDPPEFAQALMLEPDPMWIDGRTPVPFGHTASVAFRRSVLASLGGFDELLGAGGRFRAAEDQDLFDRIFQSGRRGRYEPTSFAVHEAWRDRREILKVEWSYGIGTGARLAKLVRTEHGRIPKVLRENVVYCLRGITHAIRVRYGFLLLVMSARLVATVLGSARAAFQPVRHGHFVGRGSTVR